MSRNRNQLALFPELEVHLELPVQKAHIYERVEEVTDEKTAEKFAELVAGLAVYIPATVDDNHWLSKALGLDNAKAICEMITDGFALTMDFPLGQNSEWARKQKQIADLINEGNLSANEIAAASGTSRQTVQRVKRRMIDHSKKNGSNKGG